MSQLNVGFDVNCPQNVDRSYGTLAAGRNVPYTSTAAAIVAVNAATRFRGKTILIDLGDGSGAQEWWWRLGTGDNQLVPKINYEQTLEFIIGDGGANTPLDQAIIYPGGVNPGTLINCKIYEVGGDQGNLSSLTRNSPYQFYQYNLSSGIITLANTIFSTGSWWKIKFRQL